MKSVTEPSYAVKGRNGKQTGGDVDLRFEQVFAPQLALWLGCEHSRPTTEAIRIKRGIASFDTSRRKKPSLDTYGAAILSGSVLPAQPRICHQGIKPSTAQLIRPCCHLPWLYTAQRTAHSCSRIQTGRKAGTQTRPTHRNHGI